MGPVFNYDVDGQFFSFRLLRWTEILERSLSGSVLDHCLSDHDERNRILGEGCLLHR